MDTDSTQELDEMLTGILENYEVVLLDETGNEQIATLGDIAEPADDLLPPIKQAILDWHSKQVEEVLDRAKTSIVELYNLEEWQLTDVVNVIEAERSKLKGGNTAPDTSALDTLTNRYEWQGPLDKLTGGGGA